MRIEDTRNAVHRATTKRAQAEIRNKDIRRTVVMFAPDIFARGHLAAYVKCLARRKLGTTRGGGREGLCKRSM